MEDIMPFWVRHAVDPEGGLNTCIGDDGRVVSREKWLWSQWRLVWVFSKIYNAVDADSKWLDLARHVYKFVTRTGWNREAGGWNLCLDPDGSVNRAYETINVDAFAIDGLVELAKARPEEYDEVIAHARRTADNVIEKIKQPHDEIPHYPYPVPKGARVHGIPMMFSFMLWKLGRHLDDARYLDAARKQSDDIFNHFYRSDRDLLVERIAADNSEYPAPEGTAVVPGHVIEGMWFQIHIARYFGDDARIMESCRLIRRHLELGWDEEYGGIFLAIDADGRSDIAWGAPETKLWWPQTETLYALLLAWEYTREPWCLQWYDKLHEYCFTRYPVPEHGEWYRNLDREGKPLRDHVVLPVKDPFHLPRALIYCVDVLDRLTRA
jgi:N-acylglucosamine 2-epimerase